MNTRMSVKTYILFWAVYAIGITSFIYSYPTLSSRSFEYLIVFMSYVIMIPIFLVLINKRGLYIFEPITMAMGLTQIMYFVWPMLSIINNDTTIEGFEVFDYCLEGTLLSSFSVLAYYLGYYLPDVRKHKKYIKAEKHSAEEGFVGITEKRKRNIMWMMYAFSLIGIAAFVLDMLSRGYSLSYMLSLGLNGTKEESGETGGILLSISAFMYSGLLYVSLMDKNRVRVNFVRLLALLPIMTRGNRQFLVLLLLPPIVLHYIKEKKKPSVQSVLMIVVAAVVLVGGVQYYRAALRLGTSVSKTRDTAFNAQYIYTAFSGNFDMYKTLYGVMQYFPKQHTYTYGNRIIVSTVIQFIPSALWPNKPLNQVSQLKHYYLGPRSSPWTISQLAEIYCDFSWIGCLVLMFLFGRLCRKIWRRYLYGKQNTVHDLVRYALIYSFLFQLIMRGSTYTNFWMLVFMFIPIECVKFFDKSNLG